MHYQVVLMSATLDAGKFAKVNCFFFPPFSTVSCIFILKSTFGSVLTFEKQIWKSKINYNTLQYTATHCSTLQHTATYCITLQHTATHYNTLQHTATHCNTLQYWECADSPKRNSASFRASSQTHKSPKLGFEGISRTTPGREHAPRNINPQNSHKRDYILQKKHMISMAL